MDITPFVDALRHDLAHAADAAGDDVRAAAERLTMALDPAVRLMLMDALAQAAGEISSELDGISVDVRLRGREPTFVVEGTGPTPTPAGPPPAAAETEGLDDDQAVARITLRIPEWLKLRVEEMAASRSQSLNTWLVNAVRAAASGSVDIDITSTPFGPGATGRTKTSGRRIQGWVR